MRADLKLIPVAVGVVCDERGHVLLGRREDNGLWSLPGGHMEPGETLQETVERETYEETGLVVEVVEATGVYSRPHEHYAQKGTQPVALVFRCTRRDGTLRLSDETTELDYFDPLALPPDIVPTHPERIADALAVAAGRASFQMK